MKIPTLFVALYCLLAGCNSHAQQPNVPATDASLKELRWNLNNVLSMQLPTTQPDSLGGKVYGKTFSFNFTKKDAGWEIEVPELWKTVEKDSTFGGSRYRFSKENLDLENIRIITSPDQRYTAIVLPALAGKTFLHQPYGNVPERQVPALTLGWYDRVQDQTLARCYVSLVQFLKKLDE